MRPSLPDNSHSKHGRPNYDLGHILDRVVERKQNRSDDKDDRDEKECPDKIFENFHGPEEHRLRLRLLFFRMRALAPDESHAEVLHVAVIAKAGEIARIVFDAATT